MDQELAERLSRIEASERALLTAQAEIKATMATQSEMKVLLASQAEIKALLTLLVPMLQTMEGRLRAVENAQAEMTGEMRGQFNQLGQRISDLNARLPVSLAYAPPKSAA